MNQQLAILVQRRGGFGQGVFPPSPTNGETRHTNPSSLALSRPVRLEFPKFSREDPASWVYKYCQPLPSSGEKELQNSSQPHL